MSNQPFVIRYAPDGRKLNDPRITEALEELLDGAKYMVIDKAPNGNFRVRTILDAASEKLATFEHLVDEMMEEWGAGPSVLSALRYALGVNLGSSELESLAAARHRTFDAPCDVDELTEENA